MLRFFLLCLTLLPLASLAELKKFGATDFAGDSGFLPVEQAFVLKTDTSDPARTELTWIIADGNFLYNERFTFKSRSGDLKPGKPEYSDAGTPKDDPAFGPVHIHHDRISVLLPHTGQGTLRVSWQGCSEKGLCYPPQHRDIVVGAVANKTPPVETTPASKRQPLHTYAPVAPPLPDKSLPATDNQVVNASGSQSLLPEWMQNASTAGLLLSFFLLGLGLAFTPCVLPMLPILSGIIARQHTRSPLGGFLLSLSYVLGMASTYALTGMLIAWLGSRANLTLYFQHPAILLAFAGLFTVFALSLFGLFEIRLPHAISNRFDQLSRRHEGGKLLGSFLMGLFSALVVSPCVSAPLGGALLYISTTGQVLTGGALLFTLAMGMGLPLLILGTTEARFLPKAGDWMHAVKAVMGVLMLSIAIMLAGRVFPGPLTLLLWALLAGISGVYLGALEPRPPGWSRLWKGLGVVLLMVAALWLTGAATGGNDPMRPLEKLQLSASSAPETDSKTAYVAVSNIQELETQLAVARQTGKTVMLDFFAEWCTTCHKLERETFPAAEVRPLLDQMLILRADITDNRPEHRELMDRFGVFAPPALVFFDKQGNEIKTARLMGDISAEKFAGHLRMNGLAE